MCGSFGGDGLLRGPDAHIGGIISSLTNDRGLYKFFERSELRLTVSHHAKIEIKDVLYCHRAIENATTALTSTPITNQCGKAGFQLSMEKPVQTIV